MGARTAITALRIVGTIVFIFAAYYSGQRVGHIAGYREGWSEATAWFPVGTGEAVPDPPPPWVVMDHPQPEAVVGLEEKIEEVKSIHAARAK